MSGKWGSEILAYEKGEIKIEGKDKSGGGDVKGVDTQIERGWRVVLIELQMIFPFSYFLTYFTHLFTVLLNYIIRWNKNKSSPIEWSTKFSL